MFSNKSVFSNKKMATRLGLVRCAVVLFAVSMIPSPARAAFHLWNLQELYSNSSGTLQFIELFTTSNTQTNFSVARSISVTNLAGTLTTSATLNPTRTLGPTANKTLLLGTAGLQAAGGPAPDFIIPDGLLFTGGGTIAFFGQNPGPYTALPTNGIASRIWGAGNNTINSPTNFAGQAGVVSVGVPEPTSIILVSLGLGSAYCVSRRRKAKSVDCQT